MLQKHMNVEYVWVLFFYLILSFCFWSLSIHQESIHVSYYSIHVSYQSNKVTSILKIVQCHWVGLFGRKLSNAKHAWDYFAMIIVKVYRVIEKEDRSVIIGIKTSKALVL